MNNDSFTSSFAIWIPFMSSYLFDVAIFAMLNKSGESDHSCLVLVLKGNTFSFCLLNDIGCGFVIYDLYYADI